MEKSKSQYSSRFKISRKRRYRERDKFESTTPRLGKIEDLSKESTNIGTGE